MTTSEVLGILARRWAWVLVGLVLTGVGTHLALRPDVTYWTQVKVRLIPPTPSKVNPLIAGSGSVIPLAGMLTVEQNKGPHEFRFSSDSVTIVDSGVHEGELVRLPNVGGQWATNFEEPTVDVQVASRDRDKVLPRVNETMTALSARLEELQQGYNVPDNQRVKLIPVSLPAVREAAGSKSRVMAGSVLLGLGLTVGAVVWGDQRWGRRRLRGRSGGRPEDAKRSRHRRSSPRLGVVPEDPQALSHGRVEVAVISLTSAHERRAACRERFSSAPYPWSFVDASTGAQPLLPYDEARALSTKGRTLRPAEVGCFDSHVRVMAEFAQREDGDTLLVCEDDVVVDFSFDFDALTEAMHESGVDYVRLYARTAAPYRRIGEWGERTVVRYVRGPYGTQAYLITPKGCRRFLARTRRIEHPIDDELDRHWGGGLENYAIVPHPVLEYASPTSIVRSGLEVRGPARIAFRARRAIGALRAFAAEARYRERDKAFVVSLNAASARSGGAR